MSLTKGTELIIKFDKDQAFISPEKSLSLSQMGLDRIFKPKVYWRVVIEGINKEEKSLFLSIKDYKLGETGFMPIQYKVKDFLTSIKKVSFRHIDTSGLLLTTKQKVFSETEKELLRQIQSQEKYSSGDSAEVLKTTVQKNESPDSSSKTHIPVKHHIKETFYVPLKDVRFKLGGVSFFRKFQALQSQIEINIVNYDIRDEFDAVKNYFANVLKTKKIQVSVEIEAKDQSITSIKAYSPEVACINSKLIESVRFEFVKATAKKRLHDTIDKNLFTMDEYYDTLSEKKVKSNTFHEDANALMEDLLQIKNTKHYKNLRYLSSKHAAEIMKLRFVLKPFSFIFLIEGEKNYHIIWETLDTKEATYIWHVKKDINEVRMTLKKVEDIINMVKVQGKTAYINYSEDAYQRIYHDYSNLVEGFVKWKGQLESILT